MNTERRLSSSRVSHALHVPSITVGLALLAVYVIWGSTYLAVRLALQSFPPLMLSGIRFHLVLLLSQSPLSLSGLSSFWASGANGPGDRSE